MTHPGLHTSAPERLTPLSDGPRLPRPPAHEAQSFAHYGSAIRKHLRLVVALPIALAVVAGGISLLRARTYEAHAAFLASEPSSMSSSLGALSSVASQLGIPALSAMAQSSSGLSTQFYGDLLTSQALLHTVVTSTYDASAVEVNGGKPFRGTIVEYVDPDGKTQTDRELAAMDAMARRIIQVKVDRTTGIVRFDVRTKNRQLSALIARRFLDLVNEFNLRRRQSTAGAEREFDARRAKAALDSLHGAETALADFRATNIDFSRSPRLATRESELQRRVTFAQQIYTTVAQRYEMANIEAVRNTPVITVLDGPEGLVEARPRYTRQIVLAVLLAGFVLACAIALSLEPPSASR
jgi:uncharacterized protein involved in exopolysaccharide biosynthesis